MRARARLARPHLWWSLFSIALVIFGLVFSLIGVAGRTDGGAGSYPETVADTATPVYSHFSYLPQISKNWPPTNDVIFLWSGGITTTSARVHAKLEEDSNAVRLLVSEDPNLNNPVYSGFYTATAATDRVVSISIDGLQPDTQYYHAVEADSVLYNMPLGKFKTFPQGPATFTLAISGDADTGSNHQVFETILGQDPLLFLHTGDLFYEDIGVNDVDLYRSAYGSVLASPRQASIYRNIPIVYMWDDHDYGPNNSDKTAPGRVAARLTYQEYVPHYPLAAGSGDVPIYQAFTVGRVRFLLTDTRSERTPNSAPDNGAKSMLGSAQKTWLKNEMLAAKGIYPIIVWVNSVPWIAGIPDGNDTWGGFQTERTELANFIKNNQIQGLFMISGDAHMVAIDDGTNSDYATGGGSGFPLLHAAALDRRPSKKGGPYSEGAYPGLGQFALMTVTDTGGNQVCIDWSGRDFTNSEIISWGTCVNIQTAR